MARSDFTIPLVDFSRYQHGNDEERKACVAEIMQGFTTSGFLYLTNSGLSPSEAYKWSERYFALPMDVKTRHPNTDKEANRGYSGMGLERVSNADLTGEDNIALLRATMPDLKESLEIGSDTGRYPAKPWQNHYPDDELPGFGPAMRDFYAKCDELHHELLCAIAEGLGLPREYFEEYVTAGDHVLRLLHYPSVPRAVLEKPGAVRAGSHTDYGSVTLLFQDQSGGLQVRAPDRSYVDVPPQEGAIVINAGDMLQIWTNDVIKSTHHRVVSPPNAATREDGAYSARYSIAYFAHPDHHRIIDAIETCWSESRPKKYEPMLPGDWMVKRLTATY